MKHFKDMAVAVGSYTPSDNWNKFTHLAVMDENQGLIASVGYFQSLEEDEEWGFDDYDHALECIEQANLYVHAGKMYDLLKEMKDPLAKALVAQIDDISEPVARLLGREGTIIHNMR